MNIFKEIYNALKVYCFNTNSACWEVGVIKFYKDEADNFDTSCSFEIMSKYDCFLSRISKIFLADGEIMVYNISIPRGKGKYMKRNDYVQYLNPYTRKFIICQIEEIYGDGHVLLYAVDTNEAFLVNTWELLSY